MCACCKSAIKWLECSACAIAGVFSDLEPYAAAVEDGSTGRLLGTASADWIEAASELIADGPRRRQLAERAQREVLAEHGAEAGADLLAAEWSRAASAAPAAAPAPEGAPAR